MVSKWIKLIFHKIKEPVNYLKNFDRNFFLLKQFSHQICREFKKEEFQFLLENDYIELKQLIFESILINTNEIRLIKLPFLFCGNFFQFIRNTSFPIISIFKYLSIIPIDWSSICLLSDNILNVNGKEIESYKDSNVVIKDVNRSMLLSDLNLKNERKILNDNELLDYNQDQEKKLILIENESKFYIMVKKSLNKKH